MISKPKYSALGRDPTQVQCVGRGRQQLKIMLLGKELKPVENFVYLGGTVSADQSCDKDIERRIGVAAGVVRNLDQIWKAWDITKGTTVMFYHTIYM